MSELPGNSLYYPCRKCGIKFLLFAGILFSFCMQPLYAQLVNYHIVVETKDGGWTDGYGTDNHIYMKMHGTKNASDSFVLKGNHEMGDTDPFTVQYPDLGLITRITIDVDGQLSDKWAPKAIRILRDTNRDDKNSADGWSEFWINQEIGYDPVSYNAQSSKAPRVVVAFGPKGGVKHDTKTITMVQFGDNPHPSADQLVMRYTEKWSNVERMGISSSNAQSISAYASVSYESPQTVAGTFGGEAGAAWESMIEEAQSEEYETLKESEYNWEYTLPAQSAMFRMVEFEIPHAYQVYSDGTNERIVRKLHGEIIPTGFEKFLFIPKVEGGKIKPILWQEIEDNWLVHVESNRSQRIKHDYLNTWLEKGWVVMDASDLEPKISNKSELVQNLVFNKIKFFEKGADPLPKSERKFGNRFAKETTRFIKLEVDIDYPEAQNLIEFEWTYTLDGPVELEEFTIESKIKAGWDGSLHIMGPGWEVPGNWDVGTYKVELYIDGTKIGENAFEIY